jgi:hypothetical protein
VVPRVLKINTDLTAVAVSPTHPMFALVSDDRGQLRGFSIEGMKFTNLLITEFEGKRIKSLFSPGGVTFYVCHESVDTLDLSALELDTYSSIDVDTFDMVNDDIAAIEGDRPGLYDTRKCRESVTREGAFPAHCRLIEGRHWLAILRGPSGDCLFVDGELRQEYAGFLAPSSFVKYQDPFERRHPISAHVVTEFGKVVTVDGTEAFEYFPWKTPVPKFAMLNGNVIRLFYDETIIVLSNYSYSAAVPNETGLVPIAAHWERAICMQDDHLLLIDFMRGDREVVSIPPVSAVQATTTCLLVTTSEGVFSIDLVSPVFRIVPIESCAPPPEATLWRRFEDTFLFILNSQQLCVGQNIADFAAEPEPVLLCEIVDDAGHIADSGFIVIVTPSSIQVFILAPDGFKQVRKMSKKCTGASLTAAGTLLIATDKNVKALVLPDIFIKPLFSCTVGKGEHAVVIPRLGFVLIGKLHLRFFLPTIERGPIYTETPPLQETPVSPVCALFAKKKPTQEEVEEGFKFRRPGASSRMLAETTDIMQHALVTAQERGEKLSEMEVKAEQIRDGARNFHRLAKELAEKKSGLF